MPGVTWSRNSSTVTSEPSRAYTEPSSSPITPAPITAIRFGISVSSSAPVELTIVFSSIVTPLSGVTSDPEAITMFFALCTVPSTSTSPGAAILPQPFSQSTLFFLNRNSTPLVLLSTVDCL